MTKTLMVYFAAKESLHVTKFERMLTLWQIYTEM